MTRVNCIPVRQLARQHLVAEYRELPRVFALAQAAYLRGEDPLDFPRTYRLGTGHVKFFYSRIGYLVRRQRQLIAEMRRRGYNPTHTDVNRHALQEGGWRNATARD